MTFSRSRLLSNETLPFTVIVATTPVRTFMSSVATATVSSRIIFFTAGSDVARYATYSPRRTPVY